MKIPNKPKRATKPSVNPKKKSADIEIFPNMPSTNKLINELAIESNEIEELIVVFRTKDGELKWRRAGEFNLIVTVGMLEYLKHSLL